MYILVLFVPVRPELGVIPSGQENHSKSIRSEEVLLNFSSCFWFTSEIHNRMEINLFS